MFKIFFAPIKLLFSPLLSTVTQPKKKKDRPGLASLTPYAVAYEDPSPSRQLLSAWREKYQSPNAAPMGKGGLLISLGRLVLDASGTGNNVHDKDQAQSLSSGEGHLDAGYMLVHRRRLRIYPLAGAGGIGSALQREGLSTGNGHGDTAASGWGMGYVQAGIGVDFILSIGRLKLLFGLRMGYRYVLASAQTGDGADIDLPTGPFFRVVTGPYIGH